MLRLIYLRRNWPVTLAVQAHGAPLGKGKREEDDEGRRSSSAIPDP